MLNEAPTIDDGTLPLVDGQPDAPTLVWACPLNTRVDNRAKPIINTIPAVTPTMVRIRVAESMRSIHHLSMIARLRPMKSLALPLHAEHVLRVLEVVIEQDIPRYI
jgi:hypothetical protein